MSTFELGEQSVTEVAHADASDRRLAWRRFWRVRGSTTGVVLLGAIVAGAILAPVYGSVVAKTGPDTNHAGETVNVDGEDIPVISRGGVSDDNGRLSLEAGGVPIGPQLLDADGRYTLGADRNGRDIAVRVLYGARNSLVVGVAATAFSITAGMILALVSGYFGGWIRAAVSWAFDLIWAFPVILLGVALGTVLQVNGLDWGPIHISAGSLWIPIIVIALVGIPYVGRVFQTEVVGLRQREFVEAAQAEGARPLYIMCVELLPNLRSTVLALFPILVATNIALEAGLSFLGAGVQDPTASWGKMIADGQESIATSPMLTVAPGVAILLTVLALNFIGEGLRTALNPHRVR